MCLRLEVHPPTEICNLKSCNTYQHFLISGLHSDERAIHYSQRKAGETKRNVREKTERIQEKTCEGQSKKRRQNQGAEEENLQETRTGRKTKTKNGKSVKFLINVSFYFFKCNMKSKINI